MSFNFFYLNCSIFQKYAKRMFAECFIAFRWYSSSLFVTESSSRLTMLRPIALIFPAGSRPHFPPEHPCPRCNHHQSAKIDPYPARRIAEPRGQVICANCMGKSRTILRQYALLARRRIDYPCNIRQTSCKERQYTRAEIGSFKLFGG